MQINKLILFTSVDGNVVIDVRLQNETVWLSLNRISQLFGRDKSVISRHLKNIFTDDELERNSTVAFFATVQNESGRNVTRHIEYFNLDVILSVGYRLNSKQATQFRRWANTILKDYLLKGYTINKNIIDTTQKEYQNLITLLNKTLVNNELINAQGQSILDVTNNYATI